MEEAENDFMFLLPVSFFTGRREFDAELIILYSFIMFHVFASFSFFTGRREFDAEFQGKKIISFTAVALLRRRLIFSKFSL